MKCFTTINALQEHLVAQRAKGATIGLVPTMGALHEGHLTLVEQAVADNSICVTSIFVNPTQFNKAEDLENYPKTLEKDLALLEGIGCQIAFIPPAKEMYPEGESLEAYTFDFGPLAQLMEGKHRPGHFRGVGIIIGKLFELIHPTKAYFGEKDYQQLLVIKLVNAQGRYGVEVIGCATSREKDGLAMSSRNLRLTEQQRQHAPLIHSCLTEARKRAQHQSVTEVQEWVRQQFENDPELELEYFDIASSEDLSLVDNWGQASGVIACTAAFAGPVRLIDNMILIP